MDKKVLIINGHPICREGLKSLMNPKNGLCVVGETDDTAKVIEEINRLTPDLVLLDLSLPKGSGFQLIKSIRAVNKRIGILVLSIHSDLVYAERVIRLGANGYINKDQPICNLLHAIWLVLSGKLYVSSAVAERMLQRQWSGSIEAWQDPAEVLSNRELEVFFKIGCGKTSKCIASELNVSTKTVDSHREHIKRKLGLNDSSSLMQIAVTWVNQD